MYLLVCMCVHVFVSVYVLWCVSVYTRFALYEFVLFFVFRTLRLHIPPPSLNGGGPTNYLSTSLNLHGTTTYGSSSNQTLYTSPSINDDPPTVTAPVSLSNHRSRHKRPSIENQSERRISRSLDLDRHQTTMTSLNWRSGNEATDEEDVLAEPSSLRSMSPGPLRRQLSGRWTPILSPRHTPIRYLPLSDTPPPYDVNDDGSRRRRHSSRQRYRSRGQLSNRSGQRSTERLNGHVPGSDVIRREGGGVTDYGVAYLSGSDGEGRLSRGLGEEEVEAELSSKKTGERSPSPSGG